MNRFLTRISVYVNLALVALLISLMVQTGLLEQWFPANLPPVGSVLGAATPQPDSLLSQPWWQNETSYQVQINQGRQYHTCLFGDSITSQLGNTFGNDAFNFALSGMSSVSLVPQVSQLAAANVRCQQVILAIGTNDADYQITDNQFVINMQKAIALSRQMQAEKITLLPAFYSTVAASHNIDLAGPISRVKAINLLLRQVATSENITLTDEGLQPLYQGEALRSDLTLDGVHLNARGRVLYRNALLRLMHA